jgi:hypothetical protein
MLHLATCRYLGLVFERVPKEISSGENYWWLNIKSLGFMPTIFMSIKNQEENYGPNLFFVNKGLEDINN